MRRTLVDFCNVRASGDDNHLRPDSRPIENPHEHAENAASVEAVETPMESAAEDVAEPSKPEEEEREETDEEIEGFMVINDGKIEEAEGSLIGQDRLATLFTKLIYAGSATDILSTGEEFRTLTIAFPKHCYSVSRSGPRIYISRYAHLSRSAEVFVNSNKNTVEAAEKKIETKKKVEDELAEMRIAEEKPSR
ncbi:hypothetical protein M3Y94_00689400 [Aphelenchoides besseyi]|nr:hypothetical protein M3Y94_00689400 [Aphelenchoides besseyi]